MLAGSTLLLVAHSLFVSSILVICIVVMSVLKLNEE